MGSKDLMRSLSSRLAPIREEFKLRLYKSSLGIIEQQTCEESSLFWGVPSRVVSNLNRLLASEGEDFLRFFLLSHACSHQWAVSRLGQTVPSSDEVVSIVKRCIAPSDSDVMRRGLLPLSTSVPQLNRRNLQSAINLNLRDSWQSEIDPAEPRQQSHSRRVGCWQLSALVETPGPHAQLILEFDIRLGLGDLSLARQLSLHGLFGIGGAAWDLGRPGDEDKLGALIKKHCEFMFDLLSPLLTELDAGIMPAEVAQAEMEWKEWLAEVRANKQRVRHH